MAQKIQHMWVDFCNEEDEDEENTDELDLIDESEDWTEEDDLENMF